MLRSIIRVLALMGALLGITLLGSGGAAMAVDAPAPNNVGRYSYDPSTNLLKVFDSYCADNVAVAAQWLWVNSDGVVRQLTDWGCADSNPAARVLTQPANATGIYLRACTVNGADQAIACTGWVLSAP